MQRFKHYRIHGCSRPLRSSLVASGLGLVPTCDIELTLLSSAPIVTSPFVHVRDASRWPSLGRHLFFSNSAPVVRQSVWPASFCSACCVPTTRGRPCTNAR